MRRGLASVVVASVTLFLAGCLHEGGLEPQWVDEGPVPPALVLVERQITVTAEEAPPAALPASPHDKPIADPVRFQIGAGYGALSHLDVAVCRERGLQAGYVHVHATFAPLGYVVRASVESEAAPPPPALDCIAEQLRQAGVPRFEGSEATLTKTYFVGAGAPAAPPAPPEQVLPASAPPATL